MSLIYSRPRLKLPRLYIYNSNRNNSNNKNKKAVIITILIMILISYIVLKSVTPIFNDVCIDKAKSVATIVTNEETGKAI